MEVGSLGFHISWRVLIVMILMGTRSRIRVARGVLCNLLGKPVGCLFFRRMDRHDGVICRVGQNNLLRLRRRRWYDDS